MKPWTALLGIGAACAACCAIPLAGGVAALAAGSTTLVAIGSALLAVAGAPIQMAVAVLAWGVTGLGGWWWWRRHIDRDCASRGCDAERRGCQGACA